MSFAESQRLLARLYTDAALRRRFFCAPEEVGLEWGLGGEEALALATARDQVNLFARALVKKRMRGVRQLLPRTARLLGEELPEFFAAYVESPDGRQPPAGLDKIPQDALRFASFVSRQNGDELASAVARFEACWVRAHAPGFRFAIGFFPYRMGEDVRRLGDGEEVEGLSRPSIQVWWRVGRLRHLGWP